MYTMILKNMKPNDMFVIRADKSLSIPDARDYVKQQRAMVAQISKRHGLQFACRATYRGIYVYCVADHGTRRHQVDENIRRIFCSRVDRIPHERKRGPLKGVRSKAYASYVRAQAREARERIHI
ncbi:hypothetical protein [Zhongshania sp.]|uniref:hypothetical protein n=1 Tax=Zhongshania sp. TaxID=1971902 RepID=UPI003567BF04